MNPVPMLFRFSPTLWRSGIPAAVGLGAGILGMALDDDFRRNNWQEERDGKERAEPLSDFVKNMMDAVSFDDEPDPWSEENNWGYPKGVVPMESDTTVIPYPDRVDEDRIYFPELTPMQQADFDRQQHEFYDRDVIDIVRDEGSAYPDHTPIKLMYDDLFQDISDEQILNENKKNEIGKRIGQLGAQSSGNIRIQDLYGEAAKLHEEQDVLKSLGANESIEAARIMMGKWRWENVENCEMIRSRKRLVRIPKPDADT